QNPRDRILVARLTIAELGRHAPAVEGKHVAQPIAMRGDLLQLLDGFRELSIDLCDLALRRFAFRSRVRELLRVALLEDAELELERLHGAFELRRSRTLGFDLLLEARDRLVALVRRVGVRLRRLGPA